MAHGEKHECKRAQDMDRIIHQTNENDEQRQIVGNDVNRI